MNKNLQQPIFEFNRKSVTLLLTVFLSTLVVPAKADSLFLINPNNNHAYQRFDTLITWTQAKSACESKGAHLATISSQAEDNWLITNELIGTHAAWLGGTDSVTEGQWKWITGENWNYTHWNAGEPNNGYGANEDYLQAGTGTSPTNGWNDWNNYASIPYLCEWESVSAPSLHTTAVSANAIQLFWDKNSNSAKSFRIQRKAGDCSSTNPWTTLTDVNANTLATENAALTANTSYSYRIASYYGAQSFTAYSNCALATTALSGTPHAPGIIQAVSNSDTAIGLSWNDSSTNETRFTIYRKVDAGNWTLLKTMPANSQNYTDSSATGNTASHLYAYDVRACNAAGCSRAKPVNVPLRPTNLAATAAGSTLKLSWADNSHNETHFQIWRKIGSCASPKPWTVIAIPAIASNLSSFNDASVVAAETYSYQMRAAEKIGMQPYFYSMAYSGLSACVTAIAP